MLGVRTRREMIRYVLVVTILSSAWGDLTPYVLEPPLRVDLQPPEEYARRSSRSVDTLWLPVPLDHFDANNQDTFQMRYMENGQFFGGAGSPIFIFVGGEWTISTGWLLGGNMFETARENNGYMFYTEHRYYGETLPYQEFTAENLRYLSVEQALADLAYFIEYVKEQPRFAESQVVLFGGSYAGNMVVWFKKYYPHLVAGVVASSAPILGKVDFSGYLEVVHESLLSEGGEQCIDVIRQGVNDLVTALETDEGRRNISENFRLCDPVEYDDPLELAYFFGAITWTFSGAVQSARPGTLQSLCSNFVGDVYGSTPMQKIGGYLTSGVPATSCLSVRYANLIATYSQNSNSRAWYYQTCTEYGYYQIAPTSGTVFDPFQALNLAFYIDICQRAFDERFDEAFVYAQADRINQAFGGLDPGVNRTLNIHGTIDPWHVLGVHDRDLQEGSPTYTVPRASHCFDLQDWLPTNTIKMSQAQVAARRIVSQWLS